MKRSSSPTLKAGAAHVTGIEVRGAMVEASRETLRHYDVPESAFEFITGDLNHQTKAPISCDVVLCLGYFYHTLNHLALFEYMASTGAKHIVLDGLVTPGDENIINVYPENVFSDANGLTAAGVVDGCILVGRPSVATLKLMLQHFGYEAAVFDWPALLAARGVVPDLTRQAEVEHWVVETSQRQSSWPPRGIL